MKLHTPERQEKMPKGPNQGGDPGQTVTLALDSIKLEGNLGIPEGAQGIVLFAHGSGSSRFSPRNRLVAEKLRNSGLATLLVDLLTEEEDVIDQRTRELRFNIDLLSRRLGGATNWIQNQPATKSLNIGYFGASTGAACAIRAAVAHAGVVKAIVSRGGRPDLAKQQLPDLQAPTLLIVGGNDAAGKQVNEEALTRLTTEKEMRVLEGASHLLEEAGKLEAVAQLAQQWFQKYLV